MTAHELRYQLRRRGLGGGPLWRPIGALAALGFGFLVSGYLIRIQPLVAYAAPVVMITTIASLRFPVATVSFLFFLTGTFGTIEAFTGFGVRQGVDALLIGMWLSVGWMYFVERRERVVWLWPGIVVAAGYVLVSLLQISTATGLLIGLQAFRVTAWYMLSFLLLALMPLTDEMRARLWRAVVLLALAVGAYATFRWAVGPAGKERVLAAARPNNLFEGKLRAVGSFTTAKELSAWCAAATPFCLAFGLANERRWRLVGLAAAGACVIGLFAANVRVGVAAAGIGIVLVLALYQIARGFTGLHIGVTLAVTFVIVVGGAGAFVLTLGKSHSAVQRFTVIFTPSKDDSYRARTDKWKVAMRDIRKHPFGGGLGTAGETQQRYGQYTSVASSSVDNSFLTLTLQQGIPVFFLYAAAILTLFIGLLRRAVTTLDRAGAGMAIGACGTLASFLVLMYGGDYYQGLTALAAWVIIGLGVGHFVSVPARAPAPAPEAATA